tara:strand:- start:1263 stop:2189 length:927 start_codon:yes stop_codon:yes gene_type:complete
MKISIVTPTFNEEENIEKLYKSIKETFSKINCDYEHIVIDNYSSDQTINILKNLAAKDKNLKVIINSKNFGHIRSPFHGILQSDGDATILMASDFQDPIELIPKYIEYWQKGFDVVLGRKKSSDENKYLYSLRSMFYKFLNKISDNSLTENTTGSGIFDKKIINQLKKVEDPYPYFRGLINELTSNIKTIEFNQPKRKFGETKNNFFTLYDIGILGIVKHSRKPLRFMVMIGFLTSLFCIFISIFYFFYKLIYWDSFSLGLAPIVIGSFLFSSIQITLMGLLGEYVGVILLHSRKMPLVIEKERINFD